MNLSNHIEALLFSRAEPWAVDELAKALSENKENIEMAITELAETRAQTGLVILRSENAITLGTHPESSELLAKLHKEELEKTLSKASVETLAIIMYGNDVTRGVIDYIRGVNSSFILRSLLVRGLIERKPYEKDKKRFAYTPTIELLASLGVQKVQDLPDYEKINNELTSQSTKANLEGNQDDLTS